MADKLINQDVDIPDVPPIAKDDDEGKGVIGWIKEKLNIAQDTKDNDVIPEPEPVVDLTKIDKTFIDAAKKDGWEDKDIVEFAKSYSADELKEMIPFLSGKETTPEVKVDSDGSFIPDVFTDAARVAGLSDDKIVDLADKYTNEQLSNPETIKEILTPKNVPSKELQQLQEKIEALEKEVKQSKKVQEVDSLDNEASTATKFFDEMGKTFSVFGQTEKLPKFPSGERKGQLIPTTQEVQAREEVWKVAQAFKTKMGLSFQDALQEAFVLYKGRNLEQEVRRSVIKDLKSKESRLSGKRVGRSTQLDLSEDVDAEDKDNAEAVTEVMRKANYKMD